MDPAMYIFLNASLGMSTGKAAAQAGHAAVEGFRASEPELINEWYKGKHYKKLVMHADDEVHLMVIREYLNERSIGAELIIDEGMTEIRPYTVTALGVEIVDKDNPEVQSMFQNFKLYRDPLPVPRVADEKKRKRRWWHGT